MATDKSKTSRAPQPSDEEETELRSSDVEQSPSGIQKAPEGPDHSEDGATDAVGMTGQRKAHVGGSSSPKSVKGTASPTKKG